MLNFRGGGDGVYYVLLCWENAVHVSMKVCRLKLVLIDIGIVAEPLPVSLSVGGQGFHFPHFPQISIGFSYFASSLTHFLPQFSPSGGRLAHLGKPWLHHCIMGHLTEQKKRNL